MYGAGDVRVETVPDARLKEPTDAVVRVTRSCICGSDLWPYQKMPKSETGNRMGHEFIGVVEDVGSAVRTVKKGDVVVAPFAISDGTCEFCQHGLQTSCVHGAWWGGTEQDGGQGEAVRVPLADGTLVQVPGSGHSDETLLGLMTLSDVFPTGHHAAVCAGAKAGDTVAVVGDGAVGLCGVLAAAQMGAERVIAMSRHQSRQEIARAFGATDVVAERGKEGAAVIKQLTHGVGADAVLECVGTNDAMGQAFAVARPGSTVGFVGVPHGVDLPVGRMFAKNVGLAGGVAPVRRYLPELLDLVTSGAVNPGLVFDTVLPLDQVADGYRAMDQRTAIKVMLRP